MNINLIINGIIIILVSLILNYFRRMMGGIFNLILFIAVIILFIIVFIRIIEGLISRPIKRTPKVIHHVHHYEKPSSKKKRR